MQCLGGENEKKFDYFYAMKAEFKWTYRYIDRTYHLKTPCGFECTVKYFPELVYIIWYVFHEGKELKDVVPF